MRTRDPEDGGILAVHPLLWVLPPGEVAALLQRQPGVRTLRLDLARRVARVMFDARVTSMASLQAFIEECARHCAGLRAIAHACPTDCNDS